MKVCMIGIELDKIRILKHYDVFVSRTNYLFCAKCNKSYSEKIQFLWTDANSWKRVFNSVRYLIESSRKGSDSLYSSCPKLKYFTFGISSLKYGFGLMGSKVRLPDFRIY